MSLSLSSSSVPLSETAAVKPIWPCRNGPRHGVSVPATKVRSFPVVANYSPLDVHGRHMLYGGASKFCSRLCHSKLWIRRNLNLWWQSRKHEPKDEFRRLQIQQKNHSKEHMEVASTHDKHVAEEASTISLPSDPSDGHTKTTSQPSGPQPGCSPEMETSIGSQSSSIFEAEPTSHLGESSIAKFQHDKSTTLPASVGSPSCLQQTDIFTNTVEDGRGPSLVIAVIGATGELARTKIFPALFALYYTGCLPENVSVFGYSRKNLTDEDLRSIIASTLTCRIDHQESCVDKMKAFLCRTFYLNGGFDNKEGMSKLHAQMELIEGESEVNRIFYLSVPQEALLDVASSLADYAQTRKGWNRVIVEKPFGFDLLSSSRLTQYLLSKFEEKQLYRIDHLLGRNTIENLTVLRFSNLVFQPLWNRTYIRNVQIILSEDLAMQMQGKYFDGYGVIRDIVQSHILQTIALLAMEPPISLAGEDIRNEKVKVLRSIRKLELSNVILGQFKATYGDKVDTNVDDLTPTFFAAALFIDNARWDGVPFLIRTGLGLIEHRVEIRIQFRHVPGSLYRERFGHNIDLSTNELILRDVPNEAILVKINNKIPGLGLQLDASELNLLYKDKYDVEVPDSYEQLLLDVIDGDNHLFMRSDEVAAAWNILLPVLQEIDKRNLTPELYELGGRGPIGAYYLWAKHGVRWVED